MDAIEEDTGPERDVLVAAMGGSAGLQALASRTADLYVPYFERTEACVFTGASELLAWLEREETEILHLHGRWDQAGDEDLLDACWAAGTTLILIDGPTEPKDVHITRPEECWPTILYLRGGPPLERVIERLAEGQPIEYVWHSLGGDPSRIRVGLGGCFISNPRRLLGAL